MKRICSLKTYPFPMHDTAPESKAGTPVITFGRTVGQDHRWPGHCGAIQAARQDHCVHLAAVRQTRHHDQHIEIAGDRAVRAGLLMRDAEAILADTPGDQAAGWLSPTVLLVSYALLNLMLVAVVLRRSVNPS
jgi:hypothetical protein